METSPQFSEDQPQVSPEVRPTPAAMLWLYVFGFIACSVLVFLLPAPYSMYLLGILVVGSVGWGIYRLKRPFTAAPVKRVAIPIPASVPSVPSDALPARLARVPMVRRLARPLARLGALRSLISAAFALLGFGLMIAATVDLRPLNQQMFMSDGTLKLIAGALAIGVAVRVARRLPALVEPTVEPMDRLRRFWWLFAGLGALFLAVLAETNGQVLDMPALLEVPTQVQFGLLVSGVLLLGYGLGGAPSLNPLRLRFKWSTVLPLVAVIALALFLRLWNNDTTLRYLMDELHYSDAVLGLEGRPFQPILTPMSGQAADPWIYPFLVTGSVDVFGHNWAGFRFVSAIIGTLTVVATYFLAEALFDRKTALLGAVILATLPPHVHFSRVTQSLITDPMFGTIAFMFIARALRSNHRIEWAMAGVALGLTQYFYEGGRLLFPPLMLGFVIFLALNGKLRGKGRGLLTMVIAFVVVALPIYYTLVGVGKPLFGRYNESGVGTSYWQELFANGITLDSLRSAAEHLLSAFMMFGAHEDMSVFYGGQQALVLDYLLPFFLFGAFYLLWRYPAVVVLIPLWIVATGLGNGVMRDTLASTRYYVVLPAVALAMTVGVRYLLPFFWHEPQPNEAGVVRREAWARLAIPVVAVGGIAAAQVGYYFGPHLKYHNVQVRDAKGYRDGIDAANRTMLLPGNTQPYLIGKPEHDQNVPRDWIGFQSRDGDPIRYFPLLSVAPDTITPKYLFDLPRGVNYAFFVEPTDEDVIQVLYRYFPGISPAMYSPWDIPVHKEYVLFYVPSETIPSRPPPKPRS